MYRNLNERVVRKSSSECKFQQTRIFLITLSDNIKRFYVSATHYETLSMRWKTLWKHSITFVNGLRNIDKPLKMRWKSLSMH